MGNINNRKFYSASEANLMSTKNKEEKHLNELNDLFDQIDPYVEAGKYECCVVDLTSFQKEWLLQNGYEFGEVINSGTYKDGMIEICWNKNQINIE